jgi:hypothetical protein
MTPGFCSYITYNVSSDSNNIRLYTWIYNKIIKDNMIIWGNMMRDIFSRWVGRCSNSYCMLPGQCWCWCRSPIRKRTVALSFHTRLMNVRWAEHPHFRTEATHALLRPAWIPKARDVGWLQARHTPLAPTIRGRNSNATPGHPGGLQKLGIVIDLSLAMPYLGGWNSIQPPRSLNVANHGIRGGARNYEVRLV